jgi:ribose 5-phosphate isomerase B
MIYIASDHGGFKLKEKIIQYLVKKEYNITDLGPKELGIDDDYPDYAFLLARKIATEKGALGILICRSGNGMVISANKVKGAYAALCINSTHARKAREDDNANILVLPADYLDCCQSNVNDIIDNFLSTQFAGINTRHGRRFQKVQDYEASEFGQK